MLICGLFSISLVMIGFVGIGIVFFKPWAYCPYGDTSAECANTDLESLLFLVFFYILLIGWLIPICIFIYWIKINISPKRKEKKNEN